MTLEDLMTLPIEKSSRKTMAVLVYSDGKIRIKAPKKVDDTKIREFLKLKQSWIKKALDKTNQVTKLSQYYWLNNQQLEPIVQTDLKNQLLEKGDKVLEPLVLFFLKKHLSRLKLKPEIHLKYKIYKSKWGSINYNKPYFSIKSYPKKALIKLNLKLAVVDPKLIEYVVAHEICHLLVPNHSKKFWKNLETILPDFKFRKKALNQFKFNF